MSRPDWPQWQQAIETEYNSLRKHKIFGELSLDLDKQPVGHKLIFTKKFNPKGKVIRYKVKLVAQGSHKDLALIMTNLQPSNGYNIF